MPKRLPLKKELEVRTERLADLDAEEVRYAAHRRREQTRGRDLTVDEVESLVFRARGIPVLDSTWPEDEAVEEQVRRSKIRRESAEQFERRTTALLNERDENPAVDVGLVAAIEELDLENVQRARRQRGE